MAYDEDLAMRLREVLAAEPGYVEKKMFGGIAMLLDGNLAAGVHGADLLVRVGPEQHEALLAEPGAGVFAMTGRVSRGMLVVEAAAVADDDELRRWVSRGVAFARSLPPK